VTTTEEAKAMVGEKRRKEGQMRRVVESPLWKSMERGNERRPLKTKKKRKAEERKRRKEKEEKEEKEERKKRKRETMRGKTRGYNR
jgi:hypothetical protein